MDANLAIAGLRAVLMMTGAIDAWQRTASPEQLKAFVEGIRASGGTVDLAAVDRVISDVKDSGAALDAKIAAAGG